MDDLDLALPSFDPQDVSLLCAALASHIEDETNNKGKIVVVVDLCPATQDCCGVV